MSPAFAGGGQLFRSVLRVVDENVRAGREFAQLFIELRIAGFVVGGIDHGAAGSFDAIAEAALRMIDEARGDFIFADDESVSAADFHEFLLGDHGRHVDRKIGSGHLGFKYLLEAVAAEMLGTKTVEMKCVVFGIQRSEERNALNVIPVIVSDQNVGFGITHAGGDDASGGSDPAAAEHAEAGAAIQNKLRAVGRGEFEAGRVSAVAPRRRVHGGCGTTNAPEAQFGNWASHFLFGSETICSGHRVRNTLVYARLP